MPPLAQTLGHGKARAPIARGAIRARGAVLEISDAQGAEPGQNLRSAPDRRERLVADGADPKAQGMAGEHTSEGIEREDASARAAGGIVETPTFEPR